MSKRRSPAPQPVSEPPYFSTQVSGAHRFYLELNPRANRRLSVASGGLEHCRADYKISRRSFPHLIIEFVARGSGQLVMKGQQFDLKRGSVFVYGPGIPIEINADPQHPMMKYFVVLSGREGRELLKECQILPGLAMQVMHPDQIHQIFDDLIRQGLGDHANRSRMCTVALQYLVMKIANLAIPHDQKSTHSFATYQRCRKYIEENFLQVHTLKEVAVACHIDLAYLCRLFQRFGRQSPFQYLQHLRMNRAVDLLQNSNRMVKDVAQELGFSDPYNFSRAFKRVFGVYPGHLLNRRD
ncbi:MAG: AraC family transcriptional regulator [Verrucomicrobiota bacterium]